MTLFAPIHLAVSGLQGGYGDTRILRTLSFELSGGQALGILGRNGVGKTTLMKLLAGFLRPMAGEIAFDGRVLNAMRPHLRQRLGISYGPQEGVVFDNLSVRDNLTLHRRTRQLDAYAGLLEIFPRLRERLDQSAGTLSGGEKKLVSFCRALAENAPLTLLDEPTEGVQQENIDRMARFVGERRARGAAFIVVEQNITFLRAVASQVLVLNHGEAVAAGPATDFDRARMESALRI